MKPNALPRDAVLYAASDSDANLFYATGFFAPDPVLYLEKKGQRILVLNDLELGRGKKEARVDRVMSLSEVAKKAGSADPSALIQQVLSGAKRVRVPGDFPLALADGLRRRGIHPVVKSAPFYEERMVKRKQEVAAVEKAQRAVEESVELAIETLRRARIRGERLYDNGAVVTSESLRRQIHLALLERDCVGKDTIVASGEQACDPHQRGSGPIRPNRTIVFDVFPRSSRTGYYADMSRTVLKGKASKKIRSLYEAVKEGQELGCSLVRAGVNGKDVHRKIQDRFEALGYRTERKKSGWVGFFHGTGHGIGLDIHEPPWLKGKLDSVLPEGAIVTVEPGLYYPGIGGVRIEDMVLVTKRGCRNLTRFPKFLEV